MTTATQVQMPNQSPELFPNPVPLDQAPNGTPRQASEGDDRSSSLSEIEDRAEHHGSKADLPPSSSTFDVNDTEAETERLEDSPQKAHRNQNLVLTAANSLYSTTEGRYIEANNEDAQNRDSIDRASPIVSPRGSIDQEARSISASRSPRKRKRSDPDDQELSNEHVMGKVPYENAIVFDRLRSAESDQKENAPELESFKLDGKPSDSEEHGDHGEADDSSPTAKPKGKNNDRRSLESRGDDFRMHSPLSVDINGASHPIQSVEASDSNGEDAEMEDAGEEAGIEMTSRDDGSTNKKKSAMDTLNVLENCFTSLRNKLRDDRLSKLETELEMLAERNTKHPELLGMKEVLEQRRDSKIDYENTLLRYKLNALQNKSIAEKAQIHGQYMQAVREVRDRNLAQINKEWYQINRERRNREDDVPEYLYHFTPRRSQQITQQTAYNKEVSLLSGIAKYRGFPAAPEICGAKSDEVEADLQNMGIVQQAPASISRQPGPPLRTSLPASVGYQRPKPAAEERFLEQTPWANPQHPSHHLQRQASGLSRTISPLTTPVATKRSTDIGEQQGSSSSMAEIPSGNISATARTPATGEQRPKAAGLGQIHMGEDDDLLYTPSRRVPDEMDIELENATKPKHRSDTVIDRPVSSTGMQLSTQAIQVKSYLPKVPPDTEGKPLPSVSKTPSSPRRYPVIKGEELFLPPRNPPTPQHYHRPISVSATNGPGEHFEAS